MNFRPDGRGRECSNDVCAFSGDRGLLFQCIALAASPSICEISIAFLCPSKLIGNPGMLSSPLGKRVFARDENDDPSACDAAPLRCASDWTTTTTTTTTEDQSTPPKRRPVTAVRHLQAECSPADAQLFASSPPLFAALRSAASAAAPASPTLFASSPLQPPPPQTTECLMEPEDTVDSAAACGGV